MIQNSKYAYKIGKVWGIPIKLHVSLLFLMLYFMLRGGFHAAQYGGIAYVLVTAVTIIAFQALVFTSIALHELGHSFVAIRKGCQVKEITLLFLGGAAVMDRMPRHHKDEILMAAAGPAVSASLALTIYLVAGLIPPNSGNLGLWIKSVLAFVALANLILATFNLLPAFPMDGGRILRAALTPRLGRLKATRYAATAGKGLAIILGILGLFGIPGFSPPINPLLLLIAAFVFTVGDREYRTIQIEELMKQRGFSGFHHPPPPPDDDTVIVSPPPYRSGPSERSHLDRP